jgi:hypothetical protein
VIITARRSGSPVATDDEDEDAESDDDVEPAVVREPDE